MNMMLGRLSFQSSRRAVILGASGYPKSKGSSSSSSSSRGGPRDGYSGPPRRSNDAGRREYSSGRGGKGAFSTEENFSSAKDSGPSPRRSTSRAPSAPVAAAPKPVAAVSAASGATAAVEKAPYPTFVPRNEKVTDGVWNSIDQKLVMEALEDASTRAAAKPSTSSSTKAPPAHVLLALSLEDLQALAERHGQPKYRGKQLQDALMKGHREIAEFSTIPKEWRDRLVAEGYKTGRSVIFHSVGSKDGTRKFLLQCEDGRILETVGIPAQDGRLTVCVSSQVGCPMRCTFCATGKGGFARNLHGFEILDQVMTVQEEFGSRVSNVVFMGMGEPLLNLPNVLRAHEMLNKGLGIGARHITISTVGVPNAITRFAEHKLQSRLAVSLHAPTQKLREELIPSAKAYPLEALMRDCYQFFKITGRRVSFEYTLLSGVNDQPDHARELAALLKRFGMTEPNVGRPLPGASYAQQQLRAQQRIARADEADRSEDDERRFNLAGAHVNLIPFNPIDDADFGRPGRSAVEAFAENLRREGVNVTIRITRGMDAAAACGQLRGTLKKSVSEVEALKM